MSLLKADIGYKVYVVIAVLAVVGFATLVSSTQADTQARIEQRKEVVCPSFLSIARSSRDTLIVMRNEPLCTRYVLDNLK